jgi:hypothetical protein
MLLAVKMLMLDGYGNKLDLLQNEVRCMPHHSVRASLAALWQQHMI